MLFSEDSHMLLHGQLIDAIQIKDGAAVALKKVYKSVHPYEAEIAEFFSSKPLADDPRNHCLPLLRILRPPDEPDLMIFVMPLLRPYDHPRFDTFGEVIEFFRQVFEGIQFMHQHHVAHRDCNSLNIMMDGSRLYPQGYHPQVQDHTPDLNAYAKHLTRTQRPPKYYIIDFGISRRYDPTKGAPLEYPIWGGDKTVPEFIKSVEPCDPFPTDVYYLGNMIRLEFIEGDPELPWIQGRQGFEFLKPLVDDMVQEDPHKRPTMDQVVSRFEAICMSLSSWKLRSRVVLRKDSFFVNVSHSARHWMRRIAFTIKGVPSIPRP